MIFIPKTIKMKQTEFQYFDRNQVIKTFEKKTGRPKKKAFFKQSLFFFIYLHNCLLSKKGRRKVLF